MKGISVLVCAMMVSAGALAFEGYPSQNNPPGVIQTESGTGANVYYLGGEFGYISPLTISAGNSSFTEGTLVYISNKGDAPATVNTTNTNLGAPFQLLGKSSVLFVWDKKKTTWVKGSSGSFDAPLPNGARPSGQQDVAPASEQ